jgi:maleate cis-trans isomerase
MADYKKPEKWRDPRVALFKYQVGFTSPPYDFDSAPSDFLRISPETVGVHGRMLHVPNYDHSLSERKDNFSLLEEFVECMANNGAHVCGQVGSNWVHASGRTPDQIEDYCNTVSDKYETPFHMAGFAMVEALRSIGAKRVALNGVYHWPDWWQGKAEFLRQAGFDVVWAGNFHNQGFFKTEEDQNDCTWVFDGDLAQKSMEYVAKQAPDVDAYLVNGMCNFRREGDGLPQRMVALTKDLEEVVGKPIISSDTALYWRLYKTLGVKPTGDYGSLLSSL